MVTHTPVNVLDSFTILGLFHRVILMSGSSHAPWAKVKDPLKYAVQLAKRFNCTIPEDLRNEHEKIVDCLRNITAEELLSAKLSVPSFHLDFGPSFDGVTIRDNFYHEIKAKRSLGSRWVPTSTMLRLQKKKKLLQPANKKPICYNITLLKKTMQQ